MADGKHKSTYVGRDLYDAECRLALRLSADLLHAEELISKHKADHDREYQRYLREYGRLTEIECVLSKYDNRKTTGFHADVPGEVQACIVQLKKRERQLERYLWNKYHDICAADYPEEHADD